MRTDITARVAVTCVRSTLFAGCLALLGLAGCAPVGEAVDVSEVRAVDGNGLPVVAERAPFDRASSPAERLADGVAARPSAPRVAVPSVFADGASAVSVAFDRERFAAEVAAAGAKHVPGVASLPGALLGDPAALDDAAAEVVARAASLDVKRVDGDVRTCADDPEGCVWAFSRELAGFNGDLSLALHPVAQQLLRVASDLRVARWTATERGVTRDLAVTLHGRVGGRLVGIVVFR